MINPLTPWFLPTCFVMSCCIKGIKNANVLPEPVGAHAIKSLLDNVIGIDSHWIGVGSIKSLSIRLDKSFLSILNLPIISSNDPIGMGISSPVTLDRCRFLYFLASSSSCKTKRGASSSSICVVDSTSASSFSGTCFVCFLV